ncbi:hypothetical protein QOZ80_6BG0496850 [Eleusine coracana subsp. coracana]|nr:hypothetical protein QOZ80_6BG0496850 [Eleusine coracana subsp. coracana]
MAAAVEETQDEAPGLASPPSVAIEMTGLSRRSTPPPDSSMTPSQAEEGSATAAGNDREEEQEQRRKAKAKERLEFGGVAATFGFSTLSSCLCIPKDAKHANSVPFAISLFLAFCTFLGGIFLVFLSIIMLSLRAELVSGGQYIAAKCLVVSCAAFSMLTLLSLMALPRRRVYQYIAFAVVTVIVLPAGWLYWYPWRRQNEAAAACDDEHKEELEAASKITSCTTTSAFGGLVGVLFSASKISGATADAAYLVAIFFMYATAVLGLFVMMVSKKVPGVAKPRFRRLFITVVRLANALLLCSVACAAFAAAFVVLRYRVFAAFAPLVVSGIIGFLLRYCVSGEADDAHQQENQAYQKDRVKAIEDIASKVTTATFGGIMTVLGASIGDNYDNNNTNNQAGATARDAFMVVLTSSFVSGFGFMLLAAAPGSARALMAPAANVLVWSSVALFAATAVAVYGVEVWTL